MNQNETPIITKGVGGLYTVRRPDGSTVACRARGSFRHDGITPLVGDRVTLVEDGEQGFVIDAICERKNALIRPPMANLDCIFVTMAAASPAPILTTVDKLTAIAEHNQIEPILVITKSELRADYAEELRALYASCGFSAFAVSAVENTGINALEQYIKEELGGKIAAFAGASGVGKSTLLNRLFPTLALSTSEISRKIERGRHTTRQVELFALSESETSGYIADTPGFSMLDFERFDFMDADDLPLAMREFAARIGECRYTKCSHTKEEGCAIVDAVARGEIPKSRHESFCELHAILKAKKKWDKR
ncbi:MAG: ribosome small subunit-dependent GTPase A [Clostridia bacterium]|nr:ribosome small subunit-dependent GTPase A [Clostridia bacterium]